MGQKATYVAGRPFPASRTHALESVPFVIAGASVVARGLVTLAVTCRRGSPCEPLASPPHRRQGGRVHGGGASQLPLTRVAGLPFPPVFTVTVKVVDKVTTRAPIVAGILAAVVNV